MNYTTNYHLPQWVQTDRIQMEDFNQAMADIDEGLGSALQSANGLETTAYNLSGILFELKASGMAADCKGMMGDNMSDISGFAEVPYGFSYDAAGKRLRYSTDSLTGEYLVSSTAANIGPGASGASAVWTPEAKGHAEKIRFLAGVSGVISFYFTISCNGSVIYTSGTEYQTSNWQYTDFDGISIDFLPENQYQFHVYNTSSSSTITALNGFRVYFAEKTAVPTISTKAAVIGCAAQSAVAWVHYAGTCPAVSLLVGEAAYPMTATGAAVPVESEQEPNLLCQRFYADVPATASDTAALRFTAQGDFDLYRWNAWMW